MTLGEALKTVRLGAGLSGREMATIIALDQYKLQKWESNKAKPKHEDTVKIYKFLKIKSEEQISEQVLKSASEDLIKAKVERGNKNPSLQSEDHHLLIDPLEIKDLGVIYPNTYIKLLEEYNQLLKHEVKELRQQSEQVQKDLSDVLKNQLTMVAMGQAMQDVLFELLAPGKQKDLQRTVDNRGAVLQRALERKGNRIEIDN